MPGRLIIFCGIPGSGKTSTARLVAKAHIPSVLVQTDTIRSMITKPSFSREESEFVYDSCVPIAQRALDRGYLVILDGTFGSSRRRESTLSALAGHYSRFDIVYIACDVETALARNLERAPEAVVPEKNLRGILSEFEVPSPALTVDTAGITPETAAELVGQALFRPSPHG